MPCVCVCRYDFPVFGRVMAVYVVPTAAGHCRMITRFIKNKKTFARRPGLMGLFLKVGGKAAGCTRVWFHLPQRRLCLVGWQVAQMQYPGTLHPPRLDCDMQHGKAGNACGMSPCVRADGSLPEQRGFALHLADIT